MGQPLRQHFADPPLNVLAFDLRQILKRNGVIVPRQFRIAAVQRALDGGAVEYQSSLRGAELQRGAQQALEILDLRRARAAKLDAQRRIVVPQQRAAHPQVGGDQGIDRFIGNIGRPAR